MALEQLSDVVQKCQAVQDDKYSPEDYDVFNTAGRTCIEEGHSAQVLSILVDEKNQAMVKCMGWNLLDPLVQVMLKQEVKNRPHCQAILKHLLKVCSPKELLVGLLEQVEEAPVELLVSAFLLLLKPLKEVLMRLGERKASSLGMVLSTLLEQVAKLPTPRSREQEADDFHPLCHCCTSLMAFVRPFVDEARASLAGPREETPSQAERGGGGGGGRGRPNKEDELRVELLKFCMKSLSEPLLQVQLQDSDPLAVSPLREFALDVLSSLTAIGESLPGLVSHPVLRKRRAEGFLEEEVRYPKESLASLAHLLFVHHVAIDTFPAVYSPIFMLRCNMEHINLLLSRTEEHCIHKGQELYEKSLVTVVDGSVSVNELEIKTFTSVPQNLVKIMTLCPAHHLRTKGLKLLQLSIDKFDVEAKYKFFECMLKVSSHSGVEGYIIKNIRSQIDFSLKPGNENDWFLGAHLMPLLRQVLVLPDGPETDLLQNLDRLMESLNLLRYLVLRDKVTQNQTGVWTELTHLEERFMRPLRVGLNMSRAHYEMELQRTMAGHKGKVKGDSMLSVAVGDEQLPHMTSESQIQALHSALHTFDMMESVLVRVEEVVQESS
ncbi:glomulin, FKBP associated protein a [Gadus macrocephalus]|uniref:glomulin, FKBP associated protein a n=1 Tax=Gadus macrocephalus TaxID=80720 RepID=UPI0028CB630A|nr:glomulin, FKBP associated protein a [Gadus macrocephalus]